MDKLIGSVVIGRNEADRLNACLKSLLCDTSKVIYVDSDSTDNSVQLALELGVDVVKLDISIPFTAARARNEGFIRLLELYPNLSFIQFVDGDCEVVSGWLKQANEYLNEHRDIAIVCGRRRERYPDASIYNTLCDIEWNSSIGDAKACGGDALMRINALQEVSGFNPEVIAGEEPELCVRIRQKGWKVWRLDLEMTLHDANIKFFKQWWRRNVRAGYAYALGASMHGKAPEFHRVRETKRIWLWGFWLPISIVLLSLLNSIYLSLFLLYPVQVARIKYKNTHIIKHAWSYAFFVTIGKFPEMQGQLKFLLDRLLRKKSSIIEYKG